VNRPTRRTHATRTTRAVLGAALAVLATLALAVGPAAASEPAPANDTIEAAAIINAIPWTTTVSTIGATSSATDPGYCHGPELGPDPASVWFRYTATTSGPLGGTTFGSDYDTTLYVGTANGAGGIDVIACGDDSRTHQSTVRFDAVAGVTYLFMAAGSPWADPTSGSLTFNLDVGPEAQDASLTVEPTATFERGSVVFHGTVGCAADASLSSLLIVELHQWAGDKEIAAGTAFLDIAGCPGTDIPFDIVVPNEYRHFHPGRATAQVLYFACNQFECANEVIDLEVTIAP
jgi:large repetitive protein